MTLPDISVENLARAVLSLAESAGMPGSFWYTDSRVQLACRALDVTPEVAYTTDWNGPVETPNNVPTDV